MKSKEGRHRISAARDSGSIWDHPSAQTKVQKEILLGAKKAKKVIRKKK